MTVYILIFFSALLISLAGTPLLRRTALAMGFVDEPEPRKIHQSPIPLLGGLGIYLAFIAALFLVRDMAELPGYLGQLLGILGGATACALLGLWDDRYGLNPLIKLLVEALATAMLVWSGIRVEFLHQPVLNLAVTYLWVIGITNALNFVDNMDGLAGSVASVAAAFFFLLATTSGQYLVASMSAALLGACLGFLRYNFYRATIFMGDAGSLFLGFMLAALGIKLRFENTDIVTWMIPVMVLGLPIFDTTLVTLSRLRRRVPIYQGSTDHLSHRLVALGFTKREAVFALSLAAMAFGLGSLFLLKASILEGYFTGTVVAVACLAALVWLERRWIGPPPDQENRR
ncbi:MAG: undecaprenyl/decaprenyl-phosphate alpha-N-acetylglucosaminyl 1-phosphate transferase [Chloroflexi bacterium]|nr:undecaprenyl/decaprenyl-phosphate alpha-N-acetylglucosaminyl 1-phosphate transferase [Chloroflexota bacterium]